MVSDLNEVFVIRSDKNMIVQFVKRTSSHPAAMTVAKRAKTKKRTSWRTLTLVKVPAQSHARISGLPRDQTKWQVRFPHRSLVNTSMSQNYLRGYLQFMKWFNKSPEGTLYVNCVQILLYVQNGNFLSIANQLIYLVLRKLMTCKQLAQISSYLELRLEYGWFGYIQSNLK